MSEEKGFPSDSDSRRSCITRLLLVFLCLVVIGLTVALIIVATKEDDCHNEGSSLKTNGKFNSRVWKALLNVFKFVVIKRTYSYNI